MLICALEHTRHLRKADSFTHRRFSDGDPAAKHKNPITDEELLSKP